MKHSRDYIAGLLDKFVDGLTTEAEEQNLAEYFDTADETRFSLGLGISRPP